MSNAKTSRSLCQETRGASHDDVPLNDWYRTHLSRLLVDMHIPDWDPRMLARLDPDEYVRTVARGRSSAIMLYCNSHVGPTLYPSELSAAHARLSDRDFVGGVFKAAKRRKLAVIAYYSAVYNNAAFLDHPEWRITPDQGEAPYRTSRYGTCCPNSPYRDFASAQAAELCSRYDFDGIFFDMLFWPYTCYCRHCRKRFREEVGSNIPTVINWNDPAWMGYQRARERWMSELAGLLTATVRTARPGMTVTHQMSPVLHGWRTAMPYSLTEHCDYASGDFYGPPIHQSVVCKIFESISVRKPFEFMTSRCVNLWDHVTMKSAAEMEMQAFLAPAHSAAFMFIDAINPDGSLNPRVYDRIGQVFRQLKPYEPFLGGNLSADVAIFVSSESRFDFRENGTPIGASSERADNMTTETTLPHLAAVFGAARSLQEAHIPYAVVTSLALSRLQDYKTIILPNVLVMSDQEVKAIREYVRGGGSVYASGYSSLVHNDGRERRNLGLADVFGISVSGKMEHSLAYVTPVENAFACLERTQEHLIHRGGWMRIRNRKAVVLANMTAPWYPEKSGTVFKPSFASIHSSPPADRPFAPAVTWSSFGAGRACYAAAPIEAENREVNRTVFAELVKKLHGGTIPVTAKAPRFIEITAFDKPDEGKMNISLVSLLQDQEPVPCSGSVSIALQGGRKAVALRLLPDGTPHPFRATRSEVRFDFSGLEAFSMFELSFH